MERTATDFKIVNTAEHVKQSCDESLTRLDTDYIDLFYLDKYNPETPIETPMQAMLDLIREGKIKYVGLSEMTPANIERAYRVLGDKLVAAQTEYSMLNRDAGHATLKECRKFGLTLVAYSPVGRGFLTGTIQNPETFVQSKEFDFRSMLPQFQKENFDKNSPILEIVRDIAQKNHCTPVQVALAWLLAQGEDIVPIPGTKRIQYVDENAAASDILLSAEDLKNINSTLQETTIHGSRYPEGFLETFHLES